VKALTPAGTAVARLYPKIHLGGSLQTAYKRCGRKPCRCRDGRLHGPYAVLRYREGDRHRSRYVPPALIPGLLAAIETRRTSGPGATRRLIRQLRQLERMSGSLR
jgi:hypothetical protein